MRRLIASLIVVFALGACALPGGIAPETPREKLLVAETTYQVVLLQVKSLVSNGIVTPGSLVATSLIQVLNETRFALDAWQASPDNPSLATAGQYAIRSLQRLLATLVPTSESLNDACGDTRYPACAYPA